MSEQYTLKDRINQYYDKKAAGEDVSSFKLTQPEQLNKLQYFEAGPKTVTQFENNPTVLKNYDILTDYLANNRGFMSSLLDSASVADDGPAELLRDSTARISTMVNHATKMNDAPKEVKDAYKYLRNKWGEVEISGAKEWWGFAKDYGTDLLASYETMPAILSMVFSGGTAAGAGAMTHAGARAALHTALSKTANAVGGNTVKSAAAYAGTVSGLHDLASQDLAVDLGERDDINLGQTAAVTALGTGLGAGMAYGLTKAFSKTATNKLKNDLEEEPASTITVRVTDNKFIEQAAKDLIVPPRAVDIVKKLDNLSPTTPAQVPKNTVDDIKEQLNLFVKDIGGGEDTAEELQTVVIGHLNSGGTGNKIKNNIAFNLWKTATSLTGKYLGKSAGVLTPYTKYSKTAQTLQNRLSHEFAEGLTKQKEIIGMDFSEAAAAYTGQFNTEYLKIIEPLALNTIKGNVSDAVSDKLNIAIRGGNSNDKDIQKAALGIQNLFKKIGHDLHKNGIIDKQVENYIPRMWNRKALENNADEFMELLVKSGEVDNLARAREILYGKEMKVNVPAGTETVRMGGMLDIQNQLDGSGGQFFASKRKFNFKDDSIFSKFLNTDLLDVTMQYNFQAGKALAKKKVLLSKGQSDFETRWINPIAKEMKAAGRTLTDKDKGEIISLYQHATGEGLARFGSAAQGVSDGYTLATRLAFLPLATVGSLTEIFINVGKAGFKNSAKGFFEASEAGFSKITGNLHSDLMTRHGLTSNEAWRELKKHGIAMEQAQAQIGQRLAGDDLATEAMQNVSNKFFRLNFLDQWTKFVQMTSFASGKNLIKENLEFLAAHGNNPPTRKVETLIGELNELGIDHKKGVQWIKNGANTDDKFYDVVTGGAARYTNSVILQPTAMSGLKPLAHTNPRTTVLFQLLGYPAAFTNTVIKGAVKATVKSPVRNAPKLFAAGMIMTETARWMNWLRSNGESEKLKSPTEARMAAVRRWGGNGLLFDNLQRAKDTAKYSGTITGYATAPFGPIANDILGIGHGKIAQTVGTKVPFYAAGNTFLGQEQMKKYRKFLKEKDKELKQFLPEFEYNVAKQRFAKGGEVDIPNAPAEPDERINKLTGRPYNQDAGSAFMDELDPEKVARQGFAIGSIAKVGAVKLKGFIAEAIDEYSGGLTKPQYINDAAKEIEDLTGINAGRFDGEDYDPMEADFMNVSQMSEPVDEEVEDYVMTLIKVQLNEKYPDDMPNADEINQIISKKGVDSDEYYEAMGYSQDFKEEVDYLRELKDVVDPDDSIAFDITNALNDVRQNKNYYSFDSTAQKYIDKADEGGYGELAEFLSHSIGVDDTISELGKVKMVMSEIGSKLDDPMYAKQLEDIKGSFPAVFTSKEPKDLLPEDELTERLEVYINKSTEKKPQFRGISSFAEKDFEVAFASPREMGVHVGSRGQAEFILAKKLNKNRADNELAVATRGGEPIKEQELGEFYMDETARINNFKEIDWDSVTLDEVNSLTAMKNEISVDANEMNPLTMMKGYIQVKKPLVVDDDLGNWSAQNILTTSESIFVDSIEKNLGKKIPKKKMKELEVLMSDAMDMSEIVLDDLFGDASTAVNETVAHTALTRKLQSWLNDLGFDSIKYKNTVESRLQGDVDAGYDDYSYILFEPKQYKSILSSGFDTSDPRMMYNKGGLIKSLTGADFWARDYNAEERPMEERVADYEAAQVIIPTQTVIDVVDYALDSGAFDHEIKDLGLDKATLKRDMVNIAKIESSGGHLPKDKQVSSTGAQGLFQVIESTARSVLENKQFGPKAAEAAGVSLEAVNKMSKKELQDFLLNNDRGNALFSAAIIMQKLQHNRNKNKGREDFSMGGIVNANERHTNGKSYLERRTR